MSTPTNYQYPHSRENAIDFIKEHLPRRGRLVFVIRSISPSRLIRFVRVFGEDYEDLTSAVAFLLGNKFTPVDHMELLGNEAATFSDTINRLNMIIPEVDGEDYKCL